MDSLHLAHLIFIGCWAGLVLAETVVEGGGRYGWVKPRDTAVLHYWMDVLIEAPLLLAIALTGLLLMRTAWPLTALHHIKILSALVAIGLNLYCISLVLERYRRREEPEAVLRLSRQILVSGAGVPFAGAAAWIGLVYFTG